MAEGDRIGPDPRLPQILPGGLQPPVHLFVTPDDNLQVNVRNSLAGVTVQVVARIINPDGVIRLVQTVVSPDTTRGVNTTRIPLTYGYLISAAAYITGATVPRRGQTYCSLAVQKNPLAAGLTAVPLGADYLTASQFVAWPYGRTINPTEGPGVLLDVLGTAPAAGVDWSQTVPTGARWRIRGIRALLTTSVTVASRFPELTIDDGANRIFFVNQSVVSELASNGGDYVNWVPGYPVTGQAQTSDTLFIPDELVVFQGWTIKSNTQNLQAGDQWGAPRFYVEEWLED